MESALDNLKVEFEKLLITSEDEDKIAIFVNPINESKKTIDIASQVASLDESDLEQAVLLKKIEATLDNKINP